MHKHRYVVASSVDPWHDTWRPSLPRAHRFKKNSVDTARAALCIVQASKLDLSRYLVPVFCHGLGELFRQDDSQARQLGIELSSAILSSSSEAEALGKFVGFFHACIKNKTNGAGGSGSGGDRWC